MHPESHVASIEALCAAGGGPIDADTYAMEGTYEAALRGAGGAAALVDALLGEGARTGVSALRPPGHHAETDRAMGFCFFDNVAVAARRARDAHGAERVLILDWDVHHGNGTNDIFHADPGVLFVSIHESPLYPGTGPASDVGSGAGEGYTVNLPVPGGTGDAGYRSLVEHVAGALIADWRPQLVLVSAGFDAHADDPLAGCRVTDAGYAAMTASVRRAADAVGRAGRARARGRLRPRRAVALDGGADAGAAGRGHAASPRRWPCIRWRRGRCGGCADWPGLAGADWLAPWAARPRCAERRARRGEGMAPRLLEESVSRASARLIHRSRASPARAAPSPPYPAAVDVRRRRPTGYFFGTIRRADPPPARSRTWASASWACASVS